MPSVRQITPRKRAAIVALSRTGMKYKDIATEYGISKSGVGHIAKRFNDTGKSDIEKRSGRSKITSPGDDRLIKRCVDILYIKDLLVGRIVKNKNALID